MLRDFINGWIDYDTNTDGSLHVTVTRPAALANQVKIHAPNWGVPTASGTAVKSQHLCGDVLYVDLYPAGTSAFDVAFYGPEELFW